ncbi:hypothetical protein SNE40_004056 [Patella caerulea]|uniref:Chitin-binding type-2 domain-containing protein n=1 Tax=Patella caerulea TaxID=87958 RepID=A0AAN8KCI6_PATCE
MSWWILTVLLAGMANGQNKPDPFDCSGLQEGVVWWGCRAFGECRGGEHIQTDCPDGMAYNQQSGCTEVNNAPPPCNFDRTNECQNLGEIILRKPEQDSGSDPPCTYFYTCNYGYFAGHQKCPSGLVYYEEEQGCRDPTTIPPPCGTLNNYNSY